MMIWIILFWSSLWLLVWTYVGYPAWVAWLCRFRASRITTKHNQHSAVSVSILIAARNEGERIGEKLAQLRSLEAPTVAEVIVVCDHCTDDTAERAELVGWDQVKVVRHDAGPSGKAGALNAGMAVATGDLVLFGDVRQRLDGAAIDRLVAYFDDPQTGAVSGSLQIEKSEQGVGKGIDAYWSLEKRIRHWESELDSSVGCTGAIYMIRRELYQPLPVDTILDDVVVPMQIAQQGRRVRFAPEALAFDPQPLAGGTELRRKTRTLAGNFQMLFRYPSWLFPWSCRLWWKVISHKYLRIATPVLLLVSLMALMMLRDSPVYTAMLAGALLMLGLALVGLLPLGKRFRLASIAASFLLMQVSIIRGFWHWVQISLHGYQGWK